MTQKHRSRDFFFVRSAGGRTRPTSSTNTWQLRFIGRDYCGWSLLISPCLHPRIVVIRRHRDSAMVIDISARKDGGAGSSIFGDGMGLPLPLAESAV